MIKFVIEIVIAFVIQALDQINLTIASTSESDPLSLCMYMHRSTLVLYVIVVIVFMFKTLCFQFMAAYADGVSLIGGMHFICAIWNAF